MTITTKITGEFAQHVTCQLDDGQSVFADAKKFRWKTTNVKMETRLSTPGGDADNANQKAKGGGGGMLKAALSTAVEVGKRALAGQSLAFQWFSPSGGSGLVTLAGELPGQIKVLELDGTTGWFTESRAFVCGESTLKYDISFNGFNQGRRSRNGFILEHFTGKGSLVIGGGGTIMELNPASYGGKIQVHGGAVVAFADSVTFGVEMVGALNAATLMTAAFGGSGINLVTLSGDGPVLIQATLHQEFEDDERSSESGPGSGREGLLSKLQ
jgi:uncharacterized protein (AIM24 family)